MPSKNIRGSGPLNSGSTKSALRSSVRTNVGRSPGAVAHGEWMRDASKNNTPNAPATSPKVAINGRMPAGDTGEQSGFGDTGDPIRGSGKVAQDRDPRSWRGTRDLFPRGR